MKDSNIIRLALIAGMCVGAYLGWEGLVFFFGIFLLCIYE